MAEPYPNPPVPFQDVAGLTFQAPSKTLNYGAEPLQIAEYWQTDDSAPLLLLIHGGCWLNAFDLTHIRPLASEIAANDIAVLSIEYRRIGDPGGGWPGTFEDIQSAFEFATTLPHDKIYVSGHSAGGHLALWLAANTKHEKLGGVIGLAAISDLHTYSQGTSSCQKATIDLLGGQPEDEPDRYAAASPMGLEFNTQIQLLHGRDDPIVDPGLSESFCEQHKADCVMFDKLGHFDVIDPRQVPSQTMINQIKAWQQHDQ